MKLILCKNCQDIVRLMPTKRVCSCGKSGGKYTDNLHAIYFGDMAVPIGFRNDSIVEAVINQPEVGMGRDFTAFVISKNCSTFKLIPEGAL